MAPRSGSAIRRRLARVDLWCEAHHDPGSTGSPGSAGAPGTLTVVEGKWAYCRAPRSAGHRWIATGGVPVTQLLPPRRPA